MRIHAAQPLFAWSQLEAGLIVDGVMAAQVTHVTPRPGRESGARRPGEMAVVQKDRVGARERVGERIQWHGSPVAKNHHGA